MSMRVRALGAYGSALQDKRTCGFLVDDRMMVDAGTISSAKKSPNLPAIDHVLLSHAHLDHCKDLAFLTDLIFGMRKEPVVMWGSAEVVADIQNHMFNNRLWPDFTKIPADNPIIKLNVLPHRQPVQVGPYVVTAYPVNHPVPADGFLIDNGQQVLMYSGDTGETDEIWAAAAKEERLSGVLLECSFPNNMKGVADISGHLVPAQLPGELAKLGAKAKDLPVWIYHLKPQVEKEIREQIAALGMPNVQVIEQDKQVSVSAISA
jgi:cAMP phosphodiesterase